MPLFYQLPIFSNQFILYTFSSELSYATVLTQPNEQKIEAPIFFNFYFCPHLKFSRS